MLIISERPRAKIVHRASRIRSDGAVSALCFARPRPINLNVASWTNRDEAVTCKKCIARAREAAT